MHQGIKYTFRGLGLIFRPGLRPFVTIPFMVNLLVFATLIWGGSQGFSYLLDRFLPQDPWIAWLSWLLWPLFVLTLILILFFTFTLVANLIAAPFNGLLAERAERLLSGRTTPPLSWRQVLKDAPKALGSELRKLWYFLVRAIPLGLLFLIPGLNLVAPFLWLAFNAWYLSLEYGDYPMSNHGLHFRGQLQRLRAARWPAFGLGAGLQLLMAIPLLNLLAMPAGVVGATLLWIERLEPSGGSEPIN